MKPEHLVFMAGRVHDVALVTAMLMLSPRWYHAATQPQHLDGLSPQASLVVEVLGVRGNRSQQLRRMEKATYDRGFRVGLVIDLDALVNFETRPRDEVRRIAGQIARKMSPAWSHRALIESLQRGPTDGDAECWGQLERD